MKRSNIIAAIALLGALVLVAGCGTPFKMSSLRRVKAGMTTAEVESIMGQPYQKRSQADGSEVWRWYHENWSLGQSATILFRDGKAVSVPEDPTMTPQEREAKWQAEWDRQRRESELAQRKIFIQMNPEMPPAVQASYLKEEITDADALQAIQKAKEESEREAFVKAHPDLPAALKAQVLQGAISTWDAEWQLKQWTEAMERRNREQASREDFINQHPDLSAAMRSRFLKGEIGEFEALREIEKAKEDSERRELVKAHPEQPQSWRDGVLTNGIPLFMAKLDIEQKEREIEQKERERAALFEASQRRENYVRSHPSLDSAFKQAIRDGKVGFEMSTADVEASWGKPVTINRTIILNGVHEQWVYGDSVNGTFLYFDNGVLTAGQDSSR